MPFPNGNLLEQPSVPPTTLPHVAFRSHRGVEADPARKPQANLGGLTTLGAVGDFSLQQSHLLEVYSVFCEAYSQGRLPGVGIQEGGRGGARAALALLLSPTSCTIPLTAVCL